MATLDAILRSHSHAKADLLQAPNWNRWVVSGTTEFDFPPPPIAIETTEQQSEQPAEEFPKRYLSKQIIVDSAKSDAGENTLNGAHGASQQRPDIPHLEFEVILPVPALTDDLHGFLTTEPNSLVKPIHEKAMPVLLLTNEETDTWMRAPWEEAKELAPRFGTTR